MMKNKRFAFALMAALIVCLLPVWAMAEIHDLSALQPDSQIWVADGDVITGTNTGHFDVNVPVDAQEITLIIRNVKIRDGELWISKENGNQEFTTNLIFEGTNEIVADTAYYNAALQVVGSVTNISGSGSATLNGHIGLSTKGTLNIQGGDITATQNGTDEIYSVGISVEGSLNISGGSVKASDLYTLGGGTLILPEYIGDIPAGMQFGGWDANGMLLAPGWRADLTGEVNIKPVFLPKTGDGSNIILWSALALMSAAGMAMLARKRKEA